MMRFFSTFGARRSVGHKRELEWDQSRQREGRGKNRNLNGNLASRFLIIMDYPDMSQITGASALSSFIGDQL